MDTVAGLAILAFSKKVLDVLKYATNRDYNALITQFAAWLAGVLATLLVAKTSFGQGDLFGFNLASQGFWGQVIVGLLIGSTASLTTDTLKAIDNKQTASVPPLLPGLFKKDDAPPDGKNA